MRWNPFKHYTQPEQSTIVDPVEAAYKHLTTEDQAQAKRLARMAEYAIVGAVMRSEADPDLIVAMDGFMRAFEMRAWYGWNYEMLRPGERRDLTKFFEATGRRLQGEMPDGSHIGGGILPIDEGRTH